MTLDEEKELMRLVVEMHSKVMAAPAAAPVTVSTSGAIAPDSDLDGKYGDPEIRINIPAWKWSGDQHKGKHMSEVRDAGYLDALAAQYEWSADEDVKKGKTFTDKKTGETRKSDGKLSRSDAARARGWAKRIRDGKGPVKDLLAPDADADDSVPF